AGGLAPCKAAAPGRDRPTRKAPPHKPVWAEACPEPAGATARWVKGPAVVPPVRIGVGIMRSPRSHRGKTCRLADGARPGHRVGPQRPASNPPPRVLGRDSPAAPRRVNFPKY